jgi:hypothetical protein
VTSTGAAHRHVGADAGERLEDLGLRVVEPGRQSGDRDDEPDADAQAERRQRRPALAAAQLGAHVAEEDHLIRAPFVGVRGDRTGRP